MRIPLRFMIARQQLYDLVWSKPLAKASEKLGVTKAHLGYLFEKLTEIMGSQGETIAREENLFHILLHEISILTFGVKL